ncbi:NUDIX domain-containing protein [Bradyrhizobium sp. RT3a]|uniref:NUDIX domain-containing protein n=1 Tax=unclassified Bradyrhizobium TaxID=2631580 RepID=UPI00339892DE
MKTTSMQIKRVRCILLVPGRGFVLIKRIKSDDPAYYVFPGGGVESFDASPEDALQRELQEELGAAITDIRIAGDSITGNGDAERFFYAECSSLEAKFVGEEKELPGRGSYDVVFVTNSADLIGKNILPSAAGRWLREVISRF